VLAAAVVAYSFARFEYPGRDVLFVLTLGTMMIPQWVTLIPQFLIFRKLRWLDSIQPLWVPAWFGGGAFYIFLLRQFIMSLPRELDEAAYIDGAGPVRIFWSIILPLCRPALATAAVIAMIAHWNNFMGPLIYINSVEKFTVSLGLNFFRTYAGSGDIPRDNLLMAACVLTTIPPILLFFSAQQYFVRGVVLSGIKG
jgi:multiple sugar transport system permease protein